MERMEALALVKPWIINHVDLTKGKVVWTSDDGKTKGVEVKERGRATVYLVPTEQG